MGKEEIKAKLKSRKKVIDADAPAEIVADETFEETKGLPANAHAKKLAKAASVKKDVPANVFYTQKGLKVLKLISKPGKTVSVYIGNLSPKKHKAALETLIAGWKKAGVWLNEHEAKAKMSELQAQFAAKG